MNLDRFSRSMHWENNKAIMIDYCHDCDKEIPFGQDYCEDCLERRENARAIERKLIRLEAKTKNIVGRLEYLIECMRKNAYEYKELVGINADKYEPYEKGLKMGMSIAHDILALRVEDIKKELQKAVQ